MITDVVAICQCRLKTGYIDADKQQITCTTCAKMIRKITDTKLGSYVINDKDFWEGV